MSGACKLHSPILIGLFWIRQRCLGWFDATSLYQGTEVKIATKTFSYPLSTLSLTIKRSVFSAVHLWKWTLTAELHWHRFTKQFTLKCDENKSLLQLKDGEGSFEVWKLIENDFKIRHLGHKQHIHQLFSLTIVMPTIKGVTKYIGAIILFWFISWNEENRSVQHTIHNIKPRTCTHKYNESLQTDNRELKP